MEILLSKEGLLIKNPLLACGTALQVGSVISRETPKEGMIREFKEELGIDIREDELKLKRIITEKNTIFYIFLVRKNVSLDEIVMQEEEVMDVDIASVEKIQQMIEDKTFIGLDYYEKFFRGI